MSILASIKKLVFGFDLADVEVGKLGFSVSDQPETAARIQQIIDCFIHSYNTALELSPDDKKMAALFSMLQSDLRGFAHEGAAMGIAMVDVLRPKSSRRFIAFTEDVGGCHSYMAYIGAGIALSATFRKPSVYWAELDPLTRWLIYNGFGFHESFFRTTRSLDQHQVPKHITAPVAKSEFDAGLGRGLWFVLGADPGRIQASISRFPESRQRDIWSGVGLASAYACGVNRTHIEAILEASGPHQAALAQGSVLAAHTRHRAGNPAPHVDMVAQVYWQRDSLELHRMAQAAIENTKSPTSGAAPEHWSRFIDDLRGRHLQVAYREVA